MVFGTNYKGHIGVIGCGVVGGAVANGFEDRDFRVSRFDKYKQEHDELSGCIAAEAIFVCVPTPTLEDGTQDIDALEEVLALLKGNQYAGVIVVKSTVLPGTTERLARKYRFSKVCHNPEFLTAAKPLEDFMNQPCILVGSKHHESAIRVGEIYYAAGFTPIMVCQDSAVTEMAKYMHNLHLATKVSFANEIYEVCGQLGVDYDYVARAAMSIGKIGESHLRVPGPDGFGFSGMCFPKDTSAFLRFAEGFGLPVEVLSATVNGNLRRRGGVA
jgi:UDPglucose 6-dehydrogenase